MASNGISTDKENQILVEGDSCVKTVILNRPQKFNALSHQMILQLLKVMRDFEDNPYVKLIIIKGNGRAFCAGGDAAAMIQYNELGHWTFGAHFFKKQYTLDHFIATYRKPLVFILNGAVMGGGAGLSMNGRFRIVTEKTVFAMPEATLGLFPDVGGSYFLSRLPGFFGEYIGLTGARLDAAEMMACGLATHFVLSKDINLLEESLKKMDAAEPTIIGRVMNQYAQQAPLKKGNSYERLDIINKCFSKGTVEEILSALEQEIQSQEDGWISKTINSIKMGSPISLKLFLRSIREGRQQDIKDCLTREFTMVSHVLRKTASDDFCEGVRAKLLDKTNDPKWNPPRLELVTSEMLDQYFQEVDKDEDWQDMQLPSGRNSTSSGTIMAKL